MPARKLFAAVLIGIVLRFALGLHPVGWLVWFAPMPLLVLAFRSTARQAAGFTALAVLIGLSTNFHYYQKMMPLFAAVSVLVAQSLLWVFIVGATRRAVLRYQRWWTVFAYPVLWGAMDTLAAHLLPDGNWGSLAYTQADYLPILQITSLFGVAGLLFILTLVPSVLAVAVDFGHNMPQAWRAYAATAVLLAASLGYGELRLRAPVTGRATTFGLVAIDDAIGPKATPAYIAGIWQSYDQQIATLVSQGAEVIVLPEKIGMISPEMASQWQQHLSALAARLHVWIEAGVGVDDGTKRVNLAWLYTPEGVLSVDYQKHHLAPPEREYAVGKAYDVLEISGSAYGIAICKDMHFASLGRAYGERKVSAMLVPAWDFYDDRWLAARMTLTRGVENGYSVIRASRDGLLTVSDPYGRVVAERDSGALPGAAMLVRANVSAPVSTLYTRIGDLFGWLSVAAAALLLASGRLGLQNRPLASRSIIEKRDVSR
jgi:apolipoprotein N-acyltransferase